MQPTWIAAVALLVVSCGQPVQAEQSGQPVGEWWNTGAEDSMDRLGDELEPISEAVATRNLGQANRLCRNTADRYANLIEPLTDRPPDELRSDVTSTVNGIRTFLHRCSTTDSASELSAIFEQMVDNVGDAVANIDRTVWRS